MRFSRRLLLRLGAAGLLGATAETRAHADDDTPRLRSYRINLEPASRAGDHLFRSSVLRAPYDFNALAASWSGELRDVSARTSADGHDWTPWRPVTRAEDHAGPGEAPEATRFGDLHLAPDSRYFQVAWASQPGGPVGQPTLDLIDSADGPNLRDIEQDRDLAFKRQRGGPVLAPVIARSQWGCDEKLRLDGKGKILWPFEYRVCQKCVVHHTATDLADDDFPAAVRAIYRYHAAIRGWGDFGYNFLVDPRGNIYEGRAGGSNVVAGHALQYNWGSVGVAALGNYDATPTTAALRSALTKVIAWKSQFLNPHDWSYFADRDYPNLFSHRDCMATSCPGDNLYNALPALRDGVIELLGQVPRPSARVTAVAITPERVFVGGLVKIEVTVENNGTATLPTARPFQSLVYGEDESYVTKRLPTRRGGFRIGVGLGSTAAATPYPYRWGFNDALEPGDSAKVTGYVRVGKAQTTDIWAGLLLEDQAIGNGRLGATTLRVEQGNRVTAPTVGRR